ncbi:TatD family hydrolase [Geothermobacter ehrlichii]|nr:TatD family hydrolase [Geothermobacter ehrlichii]
MKADQSQLFDTHVHLDRLGPDQDSATALAEAGRAGVGAWLVPGVRRQHWPDLLSLAGAPRIWAAPGLHPMMAGQWGAAAEVELAELLQRPECVAVGEIGLDGLLDVPFQLQEPAFRGQLRLAVAAGKPVLIHCRRAWGELLAILRQEQAGRVGGILHGFGGSPRIASEALELGFVIAFGGPLTYPNARKRVEVLRTLPVEAIVLETDAPDLPPHPHRKEPNRPEWLPLIARRVAEIRGWSLAETARITTANARRVLNLQKEWGQN